MVRESRELRSRICFFRDNAGYSVRPGETREQGRLRGARLLAEAELWLSAQNGHTIKWVYEDTPDYEGIDHREPLWGCIVDVPGVGPRALWNIDLGAGADLSNYYTRVVVAELAAELQSLAEGRNPRR